MPVPWFFVWDKVPTDATCSEEDNMFARPNFRLFRRVGAVTAMLALTPLAFTAGGDLAQNDACAAREAGDKCCSEWDSVCSLGGSNYMDYYLTGMSGPCGGS